MMNGNNRAIVTVVAVLGLAVARVAPTHAQIGGVQVVFGDNSSDGYGYSGYCQGFGVIDTVSVVAFNVTEPINGIGFRVGYESDGPIWPWGDADIVLADSSSGYTFGGIELFWDQPIYASEPTVIHKVQVIWLCSDCDEVEWGNFPVTIRPHPSASGSFVEATRWPDGEIVNALGLTSIICPRTVGIEQSTWGAIKALYQ